MRECNLSLPFHLLWPKLDKSTTSFLQVITVIGSRALLYTFIQLAARHWLRLRPSLTRVEIRSILGLVLFATLSDLVFLSTDVLEWRDVLPMLAVQIVLLAVGAHRTLQQWRQVIAFKARLRASLSAPPGKEAKYARWSFYHGACLVHQFFMLGISVVTIGLLLQPIPRSWETSLVHALSEQAICISSFLFWTTCNIFDLL